MKLLIYQVNRRFLKCSKKGEFYNNVMRLKEFVEDLKEVEMMLKEFKIGLPLRFEEIKYLFK